MALLDSHDFAVYACVGALPHSFQCRSYGPTGKPDRFNFH